MSPTILDLLDPSEDYFDAAQGLYWYCSDWHGGQSSTLYSILSARLAYNPAMSERGPDTETAQDVYAALESGEIDAEDTLAFVERGYELTR
jgi:hypothetical protein